MSEDEDMPIARFTYFNELAQRNGWLSSKRAFCVTERDLANFKYSQSACLIKIHPRMVHVIALAVYHWPIFFDALFKARTKSAPAGEVFSRNVF